MKAHEKKESADALRSQAVDNLRENMESRGIGAIIWDNATAGFHYLPEITVADGEKQRVARVMGLYSFGDSLYLIEEGVAHVDINKLYDKDTEVKPTVVTLTPDSAAGILGDPTKRPGFIDHASMDEWLVVADCYFEALAE